VLWTVKVNELWAMVYVDIFGEKFFLSPHHPKFHDTMPDAMTVMNLAKKEGVEATLYELRPVMTTTTEGDD
jgi:hypothetical protein